MGEKVKVVCPGCDGTGKVEEIEFETKRKIPCVCPECHGDGWVWAERAGESVE